MAKGKYTPVPITNPEDASQVWSGRGRKPAWVKRMESEGKLDLKALREKAKVTPAAPAAV